MNAVGEKSCFVSCFFALRELKHVIVFPHVREQLCIISKAVVTLNGLQVLNICVHT